MRGFQRVPSWLLPAKPIPSAKEVPEAKHVPQAKHVPPSNPVPHHGKQKKRAKFFKRHDRLITCLGALLIFITFIAKDVLHEQWKDLGSAIEAIDSTLVVRDDLEQTTDTLIKHLGTISDALGSVIETQADEASTRVKLGQNKAFDEAMNTVHDAMKALKDDPLTGAQSGDFIMEVRHDTHLLAVVAPLIEAMHSEERKQLATKLKDEVSDFNLFCILRSEPLSGADLAACLKKETNTRDKVSEFIKETRKKAKELEDKYRDQAELSGHISWFSYTLGWALALIGSLFGGLKHQGAAEG